MLKSKNQWLLGETRGFLGWNLGFLASCVTSGKFLNHCKPQFLLL